MNLHAFGQETFATALTTPGQGRPPTLGTHAGAKTVLLFPGSLGWLVGTLHSNDRAGKESLP
jgi:hypothetical protein